LARAGCFGVSHARRNVALAGKLLCDTTVTTRDGTAAGRLLLTVAIRTLDGGAFVITLPGVKAPSPSRTLSVPSRKGARERATRSLHIFLYAKSWDDALPDRVRSCATWQRAAAGAGAARSGEAPLRASLFMVPGRALELTGEDGRDPAPVALPLYTTHTNPNIHIRRIPHAGL
jgi:hypothetical protein